MSGIEVTLDLPAPGEYRVAVHGSPYWRSPEACVTTGPDDMIRVLVSRAGTVHLTVDIDPTSALHALVAGSASPHCAVPGA